jgi:hypothetical protein
MSLPNLAVPALNDPPTAMGCAIVSAHRHGHAHDHAVQFYEDEGFLATVVGEFLGGGLRAMQSVVVIATPSPESLRRSALR